MTIRVAQRSDLQHIVDIYNETIAGRMVTADTEPTSLHNVYHGSTVIMHVVHYLYMNLVAKYWLG